MSILQLLGYTTWTLRPGTRFPILGWPGRATGLPSLALNDDHLEVEVDTDLFKPGV
ncbi:MAG: hypothetical protein GY720_02390 [bacterium]|nr:hypothetical protein [bacterium]